MIITNVKAKVKGKKYVGWKDRKYEDLNAAWST